MASTVVFRADAGPEIGGGHVVRCMTLARAFRRRGWRCILACRPGTTETVPLTATAAVTIVDLNGPPDTEATELQARLSSPDLLVIDHYERDLVFERACQRWAQRIFVIDDAPSRPHDCDSLLDQTLDRSTGAYDDIVRPDTRRLVGVEFALLRPEFAAWRPTTLERHARRDRVNRILVSLGAQPPLDILTRVVRHIESVSTDVEVDVMAGASATDARFLPELRGSTGLTLHFHGFEANPAALMAGADVVIGAGGTSSWERCCMGLPSLTLTLAENQTEIARRLDTLGATSWITLTQLPAALSELIASPEARARMSRKAAKVCDGQGVLRVLSDLQRPETDHLEREITARLSELGDSDRILAWQHIASTRRYARNPEPPSAEEHAKWIQRHVVNRESILLTILCAGDPCGIVRFHARPDIPSPTEQPLEISIALAPEYRGHGIGLAALRLCRDFMAGSHLLAAIHPDNTASRRAFASVGFVEREDGWHECRHDTGAYTIF